MSRWFRFYDDAMNDPKLLRLSDELYRAWTILLCVASKNGGILPPTEDIALALRLKPAKVAEWITKLVHGGLLDNNEGVFAPHNWNGRQYKSDVSSDRVAKYRDKRKANGLPALGDYTKFKPALIRRDGIECVYCCSPGNLVVDHMDPITLGGTDDLDNLALACKSCNSGKAGRTPEMARMKITVTSAANALARYRDSRAGVTVTETAPEAEAEQSRAEQRPRAGIDRVEVDLSQQVAKAFSDVGREQPALSLVPVWLSRGYAPAMVVEVVRELLARKPDIASLAYFDSALAERHDKRAMAPSERMAAATSIDLDKVVSLFVRTGVWSRYAGPEPGQIGCRVSAEMLERHGLAPDGRKIRKAS